MWFGIMSRRPSSQAQESGPQRDALYASKERHGEFWRVDRQPVANPDGAIKIDRQPAEYVADTGLQCNAQKKSGGVGGREEACEGNAFLEIQPHRNAQRHQYDRHQDLYDDGGFAPAPMAQITIPVKRANHLVEKQGRRPRHQHAQRIDDPGAIGRAKQWPGSASILQSRPPQEARIPKATE